MSQHLEAVTTLAGDLLRGFAWGIPVHEGEDAPASLQDLKLSPEAETALVELTSLFRTHPGTLPLIEKLDAWVNGYEWMEDLREFLMDAAILKILITGTDAQGEAFLDSPEWLEVEEATADRGTELLNFLVYIRDCSENELEPSMDDFLNEFLLVSDDQFQDEFFIYESMVKNQAAVEGSSEDIITLGNSQEEPEMEDMFTPIVLFFKDRSEKGGNHTLEILAQSIMPSVHSALYTAITGFYVSESKAASN